MALPSNSEIKTHIYLQFNGDIKTPQTAHLRFRVKTHHVNNKAPFNRYTYLPIYQLYVNCLRPLVPFGEPTTFCSTSKNNGASRTDLSIHPVSRPRPHAIRYCFLWRPFVPVSCAKVYTRTHTQPHPSRRRRRRCRKTNGKDIAP